MRRSLNLRRLKFSPNFIEADSCCASKILTHRSVNEVNDFISEFCHESDDAGLCARQEID